MSLCNLWSVSCLHTLLCSGYASPFSQLQIATAEILTWSSLISFGTVQKTLKKAVYLFLSATVVCFEHNKEHHKNTMNIEVLSSFYQKSIVQP